MVKTAIKLLNKRVKEESRNPLLFFFLIFFRLILREQNNCNFDLNSDVNGKETFGGFEIRKKELETQSQFVLLEKEGCCNCSFSKRTPFRTKHAHQLEHFASAKRT